MSCEEDGNYARKFLEGVCTLQAGLIDTHNSFMCQPRYKIYPCFARVL